MSENENENGQQDNQAASADDPKQSGDNSPGAAYTSIIEQQTKQIEALIKQNENLTAQVTKMIETGAQIRDEGAGKAEPEPNMGENFKRPEIEARDDKDDFSVDYLGKFIGGKHN